MQEKQHDKANRTVIGFLLHIENHPVSYSQTTYMRYVYACFFFYREASGFFVFLRRIPAIL